MAFDRSLSTVMTRLLFVGLALLSSSLTASCALQTSDSGVQLLRGGPGRRMLLRHGGEPDPYAMGESETAADSLLGRLQRGLTDTNWMHTKENGDEGWFKNGKFYKKNPKPCSPPEDSEDPLTPEEKGPYPSKDDEDPSMPEEDGPSPPEEDSPMPEKDGPSSPEEDTADSPMPEGKDPSLSDDNADSPVPDAEGPYPPKEDTADSPMPEGEDPSLSDENTAEKPMPDDGSGPGSEGTSMPSDEEAPEEEAPEEDMPVAAGVDKSKYAVPEEVEGAENPGDEGGDGSELAESPDALPYGDAPEAEPTEEYEGSGEAPGPMGDYNEEGPVEVPGPSVEYDGEPGEAAGPMEDYEKGGAPGPSMEYDGELDGEMPSGPSPDDEGVDDMPQKDVAPPPVESGDDSTPTPCKKTKH